MSGERTELEKVDAAAGSLADDLESARPRQLVYVNRRGEVQSSRRYRNMNRAGIAVIVALGGSATVAYGLMLGAGGVAMALGAVVIGTLPWWQYRRLSRGLRHLVRDELDAAESSFKAVASARFVPRQMRALAWQNLGAVCARRGDFEGALQRQRKSRAIFERVWRKPVFSHLVDLAMVHSLVELDRLGEAQALIEECRERLPSGRYLQVQLWSAELYVAFAEGEHRFSDEELFQRARTGLEISSAVGLLVLVAWAYLHSEDNDQAGHLLGQGLDREGIALVQSTMPRLWTWVESHRDLAVGLDD